MDKQNVNAITQDAVKNNARTKVYANMYVSHLGKVLFRLAVVCCLLSFCCYLSAFFVVPYIMFLVFWLIVSLGLVLAIVPNYFDKFNIPTKVLQSILPIVPYIAVAGSLCSIGAILCLAFDKRERHIGKIVFASIFGVVSLVFSILSFGGVKAWIIYP